ncbi:hypothetical protein [uncultured Nocardioides sp.]|uniref:hypothetical protein n=1 Tax=uncultured Nocardioides sp. TaxID=198441 RepID=UPI0026252543|nr:hypothetical protein [uncultured Nocardioides sp.]
MAEDIERTEAEALLETRRELGPASDRELVESFADRIEKAVEDRVDERLRRRGRPDEPTPYAGAPSGGDRGRQFALGVVSLVAGIPLTIVPMVATDGGLPAVVIAWLGIVGVNVAHAASINGPRRRRDEYRDAYRDDRRR